MTLPMLEMELYLHIRAND